MYPTSAFGANLAVWDPDRWRVRFLIEVKEMQSLSIAAKDVEVGAMKRHHFCVDMV